MKILFLTNLAEKISGVHDVKTIDTTINCSAMGLSYPLNLLKELSKYADVKIYSPELDKVFYTEVEKPKYSYLKSIPIKTVYPKNTDVAELVKEVRPDVVMQYAESIFPFLSNFDKADCKRVLWLINGPNASAYDPYMRNFIQSKKCDLVIKSLDKKNVLPSSIELESFGTKVAWLPFSIDGNFYKFKNLQRVFDTAIVGNMQQAVYYLRPKMYGYLISQKRFLNYLPTELYGEAYIDLINSTKVFLTCTGKQKYPIVKFYEVPACRTLLASDNPIDADVLGFKAGRNYASLEDEGVWYPNSGPRYPIIESEWTFDEGKFLDFLTYYVQSTEIRDEIAKDGERLVRERHTDEIRAKELYEILK